jgi:hypothetical protein
MTGRERLRRWRAHRKEKRFPWCDPDVIDELFAWEMEAKS